MNCWKDNKLVALPSTYVGAEEAETGNILLSCVSNSYAADIHKWWTMVGRGSASLVFLPVLNTILIIKATGQPVVCKWLHVHPFGGGYRHKSRNTMQMTNKSSSFEINTNKKESCF